jgi:hypothetical protein
MRTLARRVPDVSRRTALLPVLAAVLAGAVALACGATPLFVTTAPAADLELHVEILGLYGPPQDQVHLSVTIEDPSKHSLVALTTSHRLTCDGVTNPNQAVQPWWAASFVVPRVAPGGAYTCVYTDERGRHTTATIDIPPTPFAIIAPSAGAAVPLPGWLAPQATVTATADAARTGQTIVQPLLIRYDFPSPPGYTPPSPSKSFVPPAQGPYALVSGGAGCGPVLYSTMLYPPVSPYGQAATGAYALIGPPHPPVFYCALMPPLPAPGFIYLTLSTRWTAPAGAFRGIQVATRDYTVIPITWMAPTKGG